jgi:hypothetical protein
MRKGVFSALLATCVSLGTLAFTPAPAFAFDPPFAWTGALVILTVNGGCGNRILAGDSPTIIFRPKLQATEPNSAISYVFGHSSGIIIKQATTLQFAGSGALTGTFLSGRATQETNSGTFNLTVTPATVKTTTPFINFSGSIAGFAGKAGCGVTVRGTATLRQ